MGASLESYENQCFPVSHNLTVFPSQVSAAGRLACTSVLDAQLLRFSQAIKQWPSTLSQRWNRPEAAWGNEPGLGPVPSKRCGPEAKGFTSGRRPRDPARGGCLRMDPVESQEQDLRCRLPPGGGCGWPAPPP